jgi:hypothetical protein
VTTGAPQPGEIEPFGREVAAERRTWLSALIPRRRRTQWAAVGVLLLAVVVILLYLSISVLPKRIVGRPPELDRLGGNQKVQAENALEQTRNSVRTTLIQAVGGVFFFSLSPLGSDSSLPRGKVNSSIALRRASTSSAVTR